MVGRGLQGGERVHGSNKPQCVAGRLVFVRVLSCRLDYDLADVIVKERQRGILRVEFTMGGGGTCRYDLYQEQDRFMQQHQRSAFSFSPSGAASARTPANPIVL